MEILAEISGLKYTPFSCSSLEVFDSDHLDDALASPNFILKFDEENKIVVSRWVSPKRTRSYPYANVYDTLGFTGKKVTIIPVIKDEGFDGDRDFLQWDTVSLMSLLGVYVVIGYYVHATKNQAYESKITDQRFDVQYIRSELNELLSYQSDALHWNLSRIDKISMVAEAALNSYDALSRSLGIKMHSRASAIKRIAKLSEGRASFMGLSRQLAKKAQKRESVTTQPKERLEGEKAIITIKNYLGGNYYFTCDEVELHGNEVYLIEGKHTETGSLPHEGDIKDGLLKMVLFTNLERVTIDGQEYKPVPVLKLTTGSRHLSLNEAQEIALKELKEEAHTNTFRIKINDEFIKLDDESVI